MTNHNEEFLNYIREQERKNDSPVDKEELEEELGVSSETIRKTAQELKRDGDLEDWQRREGTKKYYATPGYDWENFESESQRNLRDVLLEEMKKELKRPDKHHLRLLRDWSIGDYGEVLRRTLEEIRRDPKPDSDSDEARQLFFGIAPKAREEVREWLNNSEMGEKIREHDIEQQDVHSRG